MSKLDNNELSNVSGGLNKNTSRICRLGDKELNILAKEGYVDEKGFILRENLEEAQNFLQQSGWNGILYVKGDDFDRLPESINLSDVNDS